MRRIDAEGSVKSAELAESFGVPNETIRKDLEALAEAKRVALMELA